MLVSLVNCKHFMFLGAPKYSTGGIHRHRPKPQANREWLLFCFMAIKLAAVARPAARHRQQPACQGRRRSSRLPAARPRQGQHRSLPAAPLSAGAGVATPSAARSPLPCGTAGGAGSPSRAASCMLLRYLAVECRRSVVQWPPPLD